MGEAQFEKVEKGLECCVLRYPDDHRRCGECPYNPHAISNEPCANGLKFDALALIRQQQERIKELEAAQTARVMSLEEIKEYLMINESGLLSEQQWEELEQRAPVYIEFRIPDRYQVNWRTAVMLRPWVMKSMFWDNYNKDRRCWTQRPTDAQREAEAWKT